jgi:hypothetical protein
MFSVIINIVQEFRDEFKPVQRSAFGKNSSFQKWSLLKYDWW